MSWSIRCGDVLDEPAKMPDESVHCVVTSPPYWGLRDYGEAGQIGLEPTPEEYVAKIVEVFREVRRVLRSDGACWLNLGDSYAGSWGAQSRPDYMDEGSLEGSSPLSARQIRAHPHGTLTGSLKDTPGLKPKDLVGIPWRVVFALQADGWWLRSDIIWAKPNPMPESVRDRPTKAHEYIFLLTKSERYYYDSDAIAEEGSDNPVTLARNTRSDVGLVGAADGHGSWGQSGSASYERRPTATRNKRTVWTIATRPFPEAHFAVFPPEIPETCIKAGTSEKGCCPECGAPWERVVDSRRLVDGEEERHDAWAKPDEPRRLGPEGIGHWRTTVERETMGWDPTCKCWEARFDNDDLPPDAPLYADPAPCTVLDPFLGSGTTVMVALRLGRSAIGIELSPKYAEMARKRVDGDCPLFNREEVA